MSTRGILKQACETGDMVKITTDRSVYPMATVLSLDDTTVEFNAYHPAKGIDYDFEIGLSAVETVEFE